MAALAKKDLWRERKRDEEKRQVFIAQIDPQPESELVYVDESGMAQQDDYAYGWNSLWSAIPCVQVRAAATSGQDQRLPEELLPLQLWHDRLVVG